MIESLFKLIKIILGSRLGQILFAAHLMLVVIAYAEGHGSFPTPDESLLTKFLLVINLPTLFVTACMASPVLYERRLEDFGLPQWIGASFVVFCVLFQWWLVGFVIERLFIKKR
jgi:hypothetical protein